MVRRFQFKRRVAQMRKGVFRWVSVCQWMVGFLWVVACAGWRAWCARSARDAWKLADGGDSDKPAPRGRCRAHDFTIDKLSRPPFSPLIELSPHNCSVFVEEKEPGRKSAPIRRRCQCCRRTALAMCGHMFPRAPAELQPHLQGHSLARSSPRRRGDSPPYPALRERKHNFFA